MQTVRGRYAPSPTGHQTVGNAYLCVRAYLDAKSRGGDFVLRIEDTDRDRLEVSNDEIAAVLDLLGLHPDEGPAQGGPVGPYVVSERDALHRAAADALVASGAAYWDFTPPLDDAAAERKAKGDDRSRRGVYRGSAEVVEGVQPVLRLRVDDAGPDVVVVDRIFGELRTPRAEIGEVALARADGRATYHLASVVDDRDMRISTVVRGADWLNFLPAHVLIYEALGAVPPAFAHVPLLLGPDGQKMSKRTGDTSIRSLVDTDGIPAGALVCYLANLGFEESSDLRDLAELADGFDLARMGRSAPRYDPKKLNALCRRWLAEKEDPAEILAQMRRRGADVAGLTPEIAELLLPGVRGRIGTYEDAANLCRFLDSADVANRDPAVLGDDVVGPILGVAEWTPAALEVAVAQVTDGREDRKALLGGLRDALTPGFKVTPPLHFVMAALGRERVTVRFGVRAA